MATKSNASSGGIGLGGAVFCIFLVLKLIGVEPVAGWSWWWVTAPLWGGAAVVVAAMAIAFAYFGVDDWMTRRAAKRGW